MSVDRSPPSHPPPTTTSATGREPSGRTAEELLKGETVKKGEGEGEGEGVKGGGAVTRVDSGIGKDEWLYVQRKKKSNRQDARVSLRCRRSVLTLFLPTADEASDTSRPGPRRGGVSARGIRLPI